MVGGSGQAKNQVCLPIGENSLGLYDIWLSTCWPSSLFNCNTLLGFTKKVSCSCQQSGSGEIWTRAKGQGKRVTTASSIYFERRRPASIYYSQQEWQPWYFGATHHLSRQNLDILLHSFSVCKITFTGSSQPWLERTQTTSIVWCDLWQQASSWQQTTSWQQGFVQVHHKWAQQGIALKWFNTFQSTRSARDLRYNLYHESEIPRNRISSCQSQFCLCV
jgi:hypothetical protein